MELVHFPVWTKANIAITGLQVLGLGGFVNELKGDNAGYSKFADPNKQVKVPSRPGMVILYSPALIVSLAYLSWAPKGEGNGREKATSGLLVLHFGKRVLESLFLHKYSGTMDADFLGPITTVYALTAALYAHQQRQIASYVHPLSDRVFKFGVALAIFGQLGNFWHHHYLASLRKKDVSTSKDDYYLARSKKDDEGTEKDDEGTKKDDQCKKYVIPSGGLFRFVTMPHYFFEIAAWLGLACVTQQFNAFLSVGNMISYLAGRSVATTRWYKSKFPDYPAERKHLIPFLF